MALAFERYRRNVNNFADDDQLLNTGVSYPIAFNRAVIYGAEGKLDADPPPETAGFVSHSDCQETLSPCNWRAVPGRRCRKYSLTK